MEAWIWLHSVLRSAAINAIWHVLRFKVDSNWWEVKGKKLYLHSYNSWTIWSIQFVCLCLSVYVFKLHYFFFFYKMKYLLQQRCRTTRSCRHKALLSSSGPDSIEKYSWSTRTVGLWWHMAGGPNGQPTWWVWPKARLLCGIQVTKNKDRWWSRRDLHQQGSYCNKYFILLKKIMEGLYGIDILIFTKSAGSVIELKLEKP